MRLTRSGRRSTSYVEPSWDDDEESPPRRRTRTSAKGLRGFVAPDDEDEDENADYGETVRARRAAERTQRRENLMSLAASRSARRHRDSSEPCLLYTSDAADE